MERYDTCATNTFLTRLELDPCVCDTHEKCANVTVHALCAENVRATSECMYTITAQHKYRQKCGVVSTTVPPAKYAPSIFQHLHQSLVQ